MTQEKSGLSSARNMTDTQAVLFLMPKKAPSVPEGVKKAAILRKEASVLEFGKHTYLVGNHYLSR
jgi:hypothetical protein